ncbi:MAG: glycosyl hydrolase-related protein, partial [Enterococcus sp.]
VAGEKFEPTALKRRKSDAALILRGYNLSSEEEDLTLQKAGQKPNQTLNLLEEPVKEYSNTLHPYEIRTVEF